MLINLGNGTAIDLKAMRKDAENSAIRELIAETAEDQEQLDRLNAILDIGEKYGLGTLDMINLARDLDELL